MTLDDASKRGHQHCAFRGFLEFTRYFGLIVDRYAVRQVSGKRKSAPMNRESARGASAKYRQTLCTIDDNRRKTEICNHEPFD